MLLELVLTGLPTNLNDWVIVNPKQRFFYRVLYDEYSHAAIVSQLVADHTMGQKIINISPYSTAFILGNLLIIIT